MVIVGYSGTSDKRREEFLKRTDAELKSVPELIKEIIKEIRPTITDSETIPENLHMLRTIQYTMRYGGLN